MAAKICVLGLILSSFPYLRSAIIWFPLVKVRRLTKFLPCYSDPASSFFEQQYPHILDLPISHSQLLVFKQQYSHKAEFDWSPRFRITQQAKCCNFSELPQPNLTKKLWKATMFKSCKLKSQQPPLHLPPPLPPTPLKAQSLRRN